MQNDGKIVVVGNSSNNATNKTSIALARYVTGVVLTIDPPAVSENELLLYPNPSKGLVQVELHLNESTEPDFSITDISGKEITQLPSKMPVGKGKHLFSFTLPENLPAGIYFLRIKQRNAIRTIRFIHTL
jgi:hypothetical protein